MLPLIAGLAIVSIGGAALAYMLDQQSEEEVEKRQRLRRNHDEIICLRTAKRNDNIASYLRDLGAEANRIAKEREEVRDALYDHAVKLRDSLRQDTFTPNRRRALSILARMMEEKRVQAAAEVGYLRQLSGKLFKAASNCQDGAPGDVLANAVPGLLQLPAEWPWPGKVVAWPGGGDGNPLRPAPPPLFYEDDDTVEDGALVFVGRYDKQHNDFPVSRAKAALKEGVLSAPGTGLFATIKQVEGNEALLNVSGVPMFLPKTERQGTPLIVGAELLVYPLDWRYDLSDLDKPVPHVVRVTEFREAAMGENCFDSVPLLVADPMVEAFAKHCLPVAESSEPWIIEPADPVTPLNGRLVLRNGPVAIRACVDRYNERHVIRLDGLIDPDESIPERDIYCVLAVSILQTEESWLADALPSEREEAELQCQEFALFIHDEFSRQERILKSAAGRSYIRRWLDVARTLVEEKSRKDSGICVRLLGIVDRRGRKVEYLIDSIDRVDGYLDRHRTAAYSAKKRAPEFMLVVGNTVIASDVDTTQDGGLLVRAAVPNMDIPADEPVDALLVAKEYPHTDIQQMRALDLARRGEAVNPVVLDAIIAPGLVNPVPDTTWDLVAPSMEFSTGQPRALLEAALREKNIFCIQGPPGTGKTTLIVELIQQHLSRHSGARILVASQANVAVDEVLERLADKYGTNKLVRIGNADKFSSKIIENAVDVDARHQQYQMLIREHDVAERLRPMVDFWLEECGEDLTPDLVELLLTRHQIVGATCLSLTNRRVSLVRPFDLVIVDEAARATPGELLIPMLRGSKVVMIGDHKQLPPTVDPIFLDEEAPLAVGPANVRRMYAETLFERLFADLPQELTGRLMTQYRMPPVIGKVVADLFYPDDDLATFKKEEPLIAFRHPLLWLDTSIMDGWYGVKKGEGGSLVNYAEAELVMALLGEVIHSTRSSRSKIDIAVITTYGAQKSELKQRISSIAKSDLHKIVVDTVDSFQGNQADLVIYCTTRSFGSIRFLNDPNRLNVAISRTKCEFLLIGHLPLLSRPLKDGGINHFARLRDAIGPAGIIQARTIDDYRAAMLAPEKFVHS